MAIDRKWVIYNTLTGAILNELPASEDNIYLDINNGDEATLVIPAYSLSDADRLQWTKVFKPWARGIALIDNTKLWNATGAIIFAGPIVKRSFNGREEKITLTAYGIYEYLKKIIVPPVWTEVTDATLTETFTADSWAGVMSAILQRGVDDTGKPAGWNFMKTFTGLPTVTGTGYSYTVNVIDQKTVAECLEDIRDNVSANGNEFKFTPVFTDVDADTLIWTMTVGTDAAPKINYTALTIPVYEEATPTHVWRAQEYNVDDDNTLIYNKLVINGSTDPVTANLEAVYDLTTDPDMPGLTEKYVPGVTLTQPELDAQKAARIKGSLIGDKDITLTISQDEDLQTFGYIGSLVTVDVSLSDKMAGTGTKVRAVGLRFTNANRENMIDLELMKLQARYPKLPKDNATDFIAGDGGYNVDDISYGDTVADYGSGGGGFATGGETYVAPPVTPEEPEVTDPNLLLAETTIYSGTGVTYSDLQTNPTVDGYWYQPSRPVYSGSTDTFTSDFTIAIRKMTVNETSGREPRANVQTIGTHTITAATINGIMNTLPATISVWYAGTPSGYETCNPLNTDSLAIINGWTIKNKLYLLITKQRRYANATANHSSGYRYEQKMFTLDINPADGTLSNLTGLSTKFGPTEYASNSKVFVTPINDFNQYSGNHSFFAVDDNNMLFMLNNILVNYDIVGNGSPGGAGTSLTYWGTEVYDLRNSAIKHIKGNFTTPSSPVFTESNITPIMPKAQEERTSRYWNGTNYVTQTIPYAFYYGNNTIAGFVFDPYTKKIYGTVYGALDALQYTEDITTLKTKYFNRVWVLDYGNSETLFGVLGDTYKDFLVTAPSYGWDLTPIPVDDTVYLQPAIAGYVDQPTAPSKLVFRNGEWVKERSNSNPTYTGDFRLGYYFYNVFFLKTSTNVGLTVVGYSNVSGPTLSFTKQLSPYKAIAKSASWNNVIDSTGKLWQMGVGSILSGYTPYWTEGNIYLKTPLTTSWKQIEVARGIGTYQAVLAIDTDGKLWTWGNNAAGITAQGTLTGTVATPVQIGTKTWTKIAVGISAAAGIDTDGKLWTWGLNTGGLTAQGTTSGTTFFPTQVGTDSYIDLDMHRGLMVINTAGQLKYSGTITGQTTVSTLSTVTSDTKTWRRVTVGDLHYLAIDINNKLFALGSHLNGRTGLNLTTGTATTWTQVSTDTWKDINATKITNTGTTTVGSSWGITLAGELYEWGGVAYIGQTTQQNVPFKVGTHTDWKAVFNGGGGGHALRENGMLYHSVGQGSESWNGTISSKWRTIFGDEVPATP